MNEPLILRIPNSFHAIPPASEEATKWLEARKVAPAGIYLANLAIEELVTNCIKHGYDDDREHQIEINVSVDHGEMTLAVIDDCHAFNPLEAPEPDTDLPVEERPLGGLGIHLLRKMSDRMTYERRAGRNHVSIVKRIA